MLTIRSQNIIKGLTIKATKRNKKDRSASQKLCTQDPAKPSVALRVCWKCTGSTNWTIPFNLSMHDGKIYVGQTPHLANLNCT